MKPIIRLIGKAPTHIEKKDLLDYFLYVFEFSWNSPIFEERKDRLDVEFQEKAKRLFPDYENFSLTQTWWLYVLIGLKEIAEHQEIEFGIATIDHILKRFPWLSEEFLEQQVNEIQHAFYEEVPDILVVRPLEMKVLGNSTVEHDPYLPYFLENKDKFIRVFQKHLRQRDIDKEYFQRFTMTSPKRLQRFSSFWNGYYEIFINYLISIYDFQMSMDLEEKEEEYEVLQELVLLFLVASVLEKPKIENLADDLMKLLEGFIDSIQNAIASTK